MVKYIGKKKEDGRMNIGPTSLKHGLILAPMAGFTDRAMRLVCHEWGAEYTVTEMVSAKAVVFNDEKTFRLARIREDEGACALQIFGNDPEVMAKAAKILESGVKGFVKPAAIDINMGCPVHKIYSNGEGSALMKSPRLIEEIVRAVKGAVTIPVTVKMRLGIDRDNINVIECAAAAECGGADAIAIHGRTKSEMYSGTADLFAIRNVKDRLHIPVIANGDITDGESALRALDITGANGLMIGRGAVGNPFIFEEIAAAIEGRAFTPPTLKERIEVAIRQLTVAVEDKGEAIAIPEARKQSALYLRGFRGAAALRAEINRQTRLDEVARILRSAVE